MKCAKHHRKEAIAACVSCGAGVCKECRITVQGITYCKPCLEGGKMRPESPPATSPPPPSSPPTYIQTRPRTRPSRPIRIPQSDRTPLRVLLILGAIGMIFLVISKSLYAFFLSASFWLGGIQPYQTYWSVYVLVTSVVAGVGFFGYWWNYGLRSSLVAFIGTLIFGWWLMLGEIQLGIIVSFNNLIIRDVGVLAFGIVMELWSTAIGDVSLFDVNEWLTRSARILLSIAALMFIFSGITGIASSLIIAPGPIEFAVWFRSIMILLFGVATLFLILGCIISIVILATTKFGLERSREETTETPSS